MGFKRRWDGFSLTWWRGKGSNPPTKSTENKKGSNGKMTNVIRR
jgi:hypothetical protein